MDTNVIIGSNFINLRKIMKSENDNKFYNFILNMKVSCIEYNLALDKIINWTNQSGSKYVCVSNVHMCMETFDSLNYRKVVNEADLNLPDSTVLRFAQKLLTNSKLGKTKKGVDIVLDLCRLATQNSLSIGLYGSTENTIDKFTSQLEKLYPQLKIDYKYSPPFRILTEAENEKIINEINKSGIKILFVGLGCPKQERWMAEHKNELNCVMLGVGAAFDFIAGTTKSSPDWVHKYGFEWLYRLCIEPKRLWKRYLYNNPRFVWYLFLQLLRQVVSRKS